VVTPLYIPNREVKHYRADDTPCGESRLSPGQSNEIFSIGIKHYRADDTPCGESMPRTELALVLG